MYWQKRLNNPNSDEEIENLIQEISVENNGNYGYRRVTMELRKRGYIINHKKVLRIKELTCVYVTNRSALPTTPLDVVKFTTCKTTSNTRQTPAKQPNKPQKQA